MVLYDGMGWDGDDAAWPLKAFTIKRRHLKCIFILHALGKEAKSGERALVLLSHEILRKLLSCCFSTVTRSDVLHLGLSVVCARDLCTRNFTVYFFCSLLFSGAS